MRDYKKIKAYNLAYNFVLGIYRTTEFFPKKETYGLTSQIRRAAVSVPTNIAEGSSRQHKKDYLNFLYIARGSLSETECLLTLSKDLGYLKTGEFDDINRDREQVSKTLYGLIKSVEDDICYS